MAIHSPSRHYVVALLELVDQHRDIGGIVLEICIKRDDDFSCGVIDACRDCRGLSKIAAKLNHPRMLWLCLSHLCKLRRTAIRRAVVYENQLVVEAGQGLSDPLCKRDQVLDFIENWNDDRKFHC